MGDAHNQNMSVLANSNPSKNHSIADITVLVVTYNSDPLKTLMTIESIIMQEGCRIQIIIADDGSEETNFKLIKDILDRKFSGSYILLSSDRNHGTVGNISRALPYVNSAFVKPISPGDYLYNSDTLNKIVAVIRTSDFAYCFGRGIHYIDDNEFRILSNRNPVVETPYKGSQVNLAQAKRYQIRYQDWILGAAIVYKTDDLSRCIERMHGKISLCEDYSLQMLLADGKSISFIDEFVVWYERGSGVSTTGNSLVSQDFQKHISLFLDLFPEDKDVRKMAGYEQLRKAGGSLFNRFLYDPRRALFRFWYKIIQSQMPVPSPDTNFYEQVNMNALHDIEHFISATTGKNGVQ